MQPITRQEALKSGALRYFTGKPCPYGHVSERYVKTWQCVECIGKYARDWAKSNPEKIADIGRKQREKNPEKYREWKSASQKRNRASANARNRKWEDANREKVRARIAEWQKANPEKCLEKTRRRQAAKLQRVPAWADREAIGLIYRVAQLAKVTWPEVEIHVDHAIPLRGKTVSGLHVHRNLQIMSGADNRAKATHF